MSLLKTKPIWHRGECIATERGWVNPQNNEVLVAIGNLKSKLEAEGVSLDVASKKIKVPKQVKAPKVVAIKEEIMTEVIDIKKQIIAEVTESSIPAGKQIIAEVVEDDLTKKVIAE